MNPEEEVFIMGVKIVIMAYQVFFFKKKGGGSDKLHILLLNDGTF